jgi:guanosine-3',5'-bis(diphosphate) 3'-pyrophosphohydrolase
MESPAYFSERDISLLLAALRFSSEKHRNQRRKDIEASPYVNHPIDVAETLWRIGGVRDIAVIVSALLHDIIEDTDTSAEEIKALFGDRVASIVMEVSDDKALPKNERKKLQVEKAPQLSVWAKLIKIADKISNVRDIAYSPPKNWPLARKQEYLDWSEQVMTGLRGVSRPLEDFYDETLRGAREKIS